MMLAWGMMAITAIFMSMWMKPVMPKGEWMEVYTSAMRSSFNQKNHAQTIVRKI